LLHTDPGGPSGRSSNSGSPPSSIPTSPGQVGLPGPGGDGLFQLSQLKAHPHLKGEVVEGESSIISTNEMNYEGIDPSELVEQLKDAETLHEQADIIHYLYMQMYVVDFLSIYKLRCMLYTFSQFPTRRILYNFSQSSNITDAHCIIIINNRGSTPVNVCCFLNYCKPCLPVLCGVA